MSRSPRPNLLARLPVLHRMLGRTYTESQWEALCKPGCGLCCQEHREVGSRWEATGAWCRLRDQETARCTAYAERQTLEPDCVKVTPDFVLLRHLPPECGYVEEMERLLDEDFPLD